MLGQTRRSEDCARLASNAARSPNHALQRTALRCLALLCTVLHRFPAVPRPARCDVCNVGHVTQKATDCCATRRIEDCARLASNAARPPNHALQCTAPRCLALLCTVLHLPQPIPGTEFSSPAMKQIESKFKTTAHLLLAPACIVQARLRCSERLYSLSASAAERCHTHIESSGVTTTGCMARPAEADVRMKKKYVLAAVRAMCAYAHTCAL